MISGTTGVVVGGITTYGVGLLGMVTHVGLHHMWTNGQPHTLSPWQQRGTNIIFGISALTTAGWILYNGVKIGRGVALKVYNRLQPDKP